MAQQTVQEILNAAYATGGNFSVQEVLNRYASGNGVRQVLLVSDDTQYNTSSGTFVTLFSQSVTVVANARLLVLATQTLSGPIVTDTSGFCGLFVGATQIAGAMLSPSVGSSNPLQSSAIAGLSAVLAAGTYTVAWKWRVQANAPMYLNPVGDERTGFRLIILEL